MYVLILNMEIFNVFVLLGLQLLLQDISCDGDLLSKFHQHGFKIRDERAQLIRYNKSYFNSFEIKAFKYNRTTTAHNVTFSLKVDVQNKLEAVIQAYKFLSNEYRRFPLRFQANLEKMFNANVAGLANIKDCGNLTRLYFNKDIVYHFCNFVIDETRFPPLIPNGKYQVEVTYLFSDIDIAMFYIFLEIYVPFDYSNKNHG